jgi:chromate reductase, NAD(P)H dehydrogenase (quinone)
MGQFDVPAYDGDLEAAGGIPPGADRFRERLELADAFATTASVSERPVHQCLSTPA